jgi:hypothetical protein
LPGERRSLCALEPSGPRPGLSYVKECLLSFGTKGAISPPQGRGRSSVDQGQSGRVLKRFRDHIHGHGLESRGAGLDVCIRTIPGQSQIDCSPCGSSSGCRGEYCASNLDPTEEWRISWGDDDEECLFAAPAVSQLQWTPFCTCSELLRTWVSKVEDLFGKPHEFHCGISCIPQRADAG